MTTRAEWQQLAEDRILDALAGLALLRTRHHHGSSGRPLATLLSAAPALCQLLGLALSRVRELDADADAMDRVAEAQEPRTPRPFLSHGSAPAGP